MKTGRRAGVLFVSWGLLLSACGGDEKKPPIQLGVIMSLTGSLGGKGSERLNAINLAVQEINDAGGVNGAPLEVVVRDDNTDVPTGVAAAEELAGMGVPAVIGAAASAITLAVANVLTPKEILQVTGASTSPLLTSAQDGDFLFRTCPSDALQGKLLAIRAREAGLSRAAIIHVPGAYGEGLAAAFSNEFSTSGTVTKVAAYEPGQDHYTALLADVVATNPAAILLAGYTLEAARIVSDFRLQYPTLSNVYWLFSDGMAESAFIQKVGPSEFTFPHQGSGGALPSGERYEAYRAAFSESYGADPNPSIFSAHYYDAVYAVALALATPDAGSGAPLRDAFRQVTAAGEVFGPKDFPTAVKAVADGKDVDLEGASGSLSFDANGDIVAPYDIWRVVDGQKVTVAASVSP